MWYCADCSMEFDYPVKAANPTGDPDEPEIDACPACGSDDIEDEGDDEQYTEDDEGMDDWNEDERDYIEEGKN